MEWTTLITIITLGLASWRIAHMLVMEYGPWGLFQRIRELFGIRHTQMNEILTWSPRNVLSCVWCASVWISLALWFVPSWIQTLLAVMAIPPLIEIWRGRSDGGS